MSDRPLLRSHVLYEAAPPLVCLLLVRNDICSELQWVRVTHVVAASCFGLGSPPTSPHRGQGLLVGFTGCSRRTAELITGWDFHCFMQSFIMIQMTRNRETLMRIFWVRGQGQCACVSMRERVCVWGGFAFIGYVLICLSGRVAGFLPRWSSGFSSAWWTSSGPASPSASPRSEAVPPGSQLDGHTNTTTERNKGISTQKGGKRMKDRKQENAFLLCCCPFTSHYCWLCGKVCHCDVFMS